MYQVKTEKFTGPLGKLLELIEQKQLEITQISLAEVTADFLSYIKSLTYAEGTRTDAEKFSKGQRTVGASPRLLSDFLVVAARLVLIKSKVLLPMLELTKEEEEDIKDLEGRLKIYREFCARGASATGGKSAAEHLKKLWDKGRISYGREFLASLGERAIFYPPEKLAVSDLARAVQNLANALQALIPESQTIKKAVVSIEEKMEELLNRFKGAGSQSFRSMAQQKSRQEVIVLFLAVLHLLKERVVKVSQGEQFSDITVEKTSN